MVELTGINPITECVTIASTAFKVWQKMFLEKNLIALEPKNRWRQNQQNQSVEALQWLEFENAKLGKDIRVSILFLYGMRTSEKTIITNFFLFCVVACAKLARW